MKIYYSLIALTIFLGGCSEEITNESSKPVESLQQSVETSKEDNINVNNEAEETEQIEDSSSDEILDNQSVESSDSVYSNFESFASNEKVNTIENEEHLNIEILEEDVLQLPLLEDNESELKLIDKEVLLGELVDEKIIKLAEEPLTSGYFILIDLKILLEKIPYKSLSLMTEDEELGIMVSENDPNLGIIVIEDPKITEEEVRLLKLNIME